MCKLRKGLDGFKECLIRRNTKRINLSTFKIKMKLILMKVKPNVGGGKIKLYRLKFLRKENLKWKKYYFY